MSLSRLCNIYKRFQTTTATSSSQSSKFEHVFSFPSVGYFALLNRLKVYHFFGSCIIIPSSGILEYLNVLPDTSFFLSSAIGLTGGITLSLTTLPFTNMIGHIYISEDDKLIKISSVDFFGRRVDRIIKSDDWIPISDMKPRITDGLYLRAQLTDGTKYKLFVKLGTVKNAFKMGQVLE